MDHGIARGDPRTAVKQRQSGVVLVEFSVNANGRAERAVVLEATAPELLQSSALQVVKNFKCKPGKEWANAGGPERRVKLNVWFKIDDEEAPKLLDADAEVVTVAIAGKMRRLRSVPHRTRNPVALHWRTGADRHDRTGQTTIWRNCRTMADVVPSASFIVSTCRLTRVDSTGLRSPS
jgi:TonB family protein